MAYADFITKIHTKTKRDYLERVVKRDKAACAAVAKKFGKVYRIPQSSLSFALTGLDWDIYQAEQEDLKNIEKIQATLSEVRKGLK